jgi:hypothetical protein
MARRLKYIALFVVVLPAFWYITASLFFSPNVYPWQIINAMPLIGKTTQVIDEDRTDACEKIYISRLYTTDTTWDAVYQSYLDYFRVHYNDADIHLDPNAEKDGIRVGKIMGPNIMTLRKRAFALSVSRIQEAGPTMGTYIWTSYDSEVQDAVAKANSAYAISISYTSNAKAYRENCTD